MATSNRQEFAYPDPKDGGALVNESVSFSSVAGDQGSFRTVPNGKFWRLQTLRALNGEAGAHKMEFVLTDQDGTTHAVLVDGPSAPVSVAAGGTLAWDGDIIVPQGWRVYARFLGMTGGSTCNWQYTAIEYRDNG